MTLYIVQRLRGDRWVTTPGRAYRTEDEAIAVLINAGALAPGHAWRIKEVRHG